MNRQINLSICCSTEEVLKCLEIPAFVVGLHHKTTAVNERALFILGFAHQNDFKDIPISDIFSSTTAAEIYTWMGDVLASKPVQPKLVIKRSHPRNPQPWSAVPLIDLDGNLIGFLFQHLQSLSNAQSSLLSDTLHNPLDIAQLDDLTRRELRWKTAVLSANQGVWDHDFEFNQHFLSDIWRTMRGISLEVEVPGNTEDWLKTLHKDDIEQIKAQLEQLESGQTDIVNYAFRQRHSDGHWVWIMSRGNVVRRTATGAIARMIGTDTDISDLKAIEHERARLADSLGLAISAAEMGQWELDPTNHSTTWDDRALQIFGLNDGLNHRSDTEWADMIHPDDRKLIIAYNDTSVRDRKDIACDYRIITVDGHEKYIRSRGKYVPKSDGSCRYIGVNFDLTDDYAKTVALEKARNRLEYESRHDALTGLANRRRLDEFYTDQVAMQPTKNIAAMHFDIDRFKQINDMHGHDAGDVTLKHVASNLKAYLPADVLVARVGGDEFVAFFAQAPSPNDLKVIAEHIIDTFEEPFFYNGCRIKTGVSIGIASLAPDDQLASNLFIAADIALYHAKKSGRATFRFYSNSMRDQANQREKIQDDLMTAFERDEITCHYQPQFDAQTMKLSGLEALVRWDSPKHGLVMPDQFLSVAEDMGLIGKLDEIVLDRALRDLYEWTQDGISVPRISVNISAQRLTDPGLGVRLAKMNIPPGKIVFELLESVFLDGESIVISANLRAIRALEIDIEIDDFGTGHASIVSLLRISPKRLKIDRELVQPIVHSRKRRALLEAIIRIGQMLNIEVVAEGVETDAHINILRALKCDYLQGFGLARPMRSAAIRDLLIESAV